MGLRLDEAKAEGLVSAIDTRFAELRKYLMPPYWPSGYQVWSRNARILDVSGFQEIADEMKAYLGLTLAVRVRLLTRMFDHDRDGTGIGGMNWFENPWDSEIVLSCRPEMQNVNLVATLAHEMMHAYLGHSCFRGSDEEDNELLTEASAVYFGFGELLRAGYAPVSSTETGQELSGRGTTTITHTSSFGYVDVESVDMLMDFSSGCSGCHYVGSKAETAQYVDAQSRYVETQSRMAEFVLRASGAGAATDRVQKMQQLYDEIASVFTSQRFAQRCSNLTGPEWIEVGEAYSLYVAGELKECTTRMRERLAEVRSHPYWHPWMARELTREADRHTQLLEKVLEKLRKEGI